MRITRIPDVMNQTEPVVFWQKGEHKKVAGTLERLPVPGNYKSVPLQFGGKVNESKIIILNEDDYPLSVMSKDYQLIDHREVVNEMRIQLREQTGLNLDSSPSVMQVHGQGLFLKMHMIIQDLRKTMKDGTDLFSCLTLINSIDGTSRVQAKLQLMRSICLNMSVFGQDSIGVDAKHVGYVDFDFQSSMEGLVERFTRSSEFVDNLSQMSFNNHKFIMKTMREKRNDETEFDHELGKRLVDRLNSFAMLGHYKGFRVPGAPRRINTWGQLYDVYTGCAHLIGSPKSQDKFENDQQKALAFIAEVMEDNYALDYLKREVA